MNLFSYMRYVLYLLYTYDVFNFYFCAESAQEAHPLVQLMSVIKQV